MDKLICVAILHCGFLAALTDFNFEWHNVSPIIQVESVKDA